MRYALFMVAALAATNVVCQPARAAADCTEVSYKKAFPPRYPETLKTQKLHGETVVRLSIDAEGRVTGVTIDSSSGIAAFDEAAVVAARQWLFEPRRCNGEPTGAYALVPFKFDGRVEAEAPAIGLDTEPMGFASVKAGMAYLAGRRDLLHKTIKEGYVRHIDIRSGWMWTVVEQPAHRSGKLIFRQRVDTRLTPFREVYRVLCEGPAEWCDEWVEAQKHIMRENPMPIPPPPPPGKN